MVSRAQDHAASLTPPSLASAQTLRDHDQTWHAFVEVLDPPFTPHQDGVLAGLTLAAKDMFVFQDRQPRCGLEQAPALGLCGTAAVLDVLCAAGASLVGFTTLTALAYEPSGLNGDGSRPVNPWGPHLITGGSSSGSAVAVAAGLVDCAIGSDTAGSLRIPAQACGVASYKPSYGVVPVAGAMALAPSLDCIGFLARDVAVLQKLAGLFVSAHDAPTLSLAFVDDLGAQTAEAVCVQMQLLQEKLQHHHQVFSHCGLADLMHKADAALFTVLEGEAAQSFASLLQAQSLPPSLAKRLDKGTRWSAQDLQQAREAAVTLHAQWQALVSQDTCVILPAMPCRTPDIDHCTPGHADFSARALYALSAFTRLGSLLGLPVVTIPVGLDETGAPLAIQIMGHRGQDRSVLATALRLQELCAFEHDRRGM